MRKWLLAGGLVAAIVVVIVLLSSGGGGNGYVVRGIFDSGGFMVAGEQVRVAGANVGEIESVGVTMPGEVDGYKNGKPIAVPGKAVIAMKISDPGFQDFRSDASCLIRPQSLIGEKFVDCRPTLPRAPGSKPAPALKKIGDGEPGAGQYLLPFENNSTSVDPDLINNINQLTYAQRFRLILNELGVGFAARGQDVEEIVKRANPVLRDIDRVFGILNAQRDQLAQLSADSEQILEPLSRDRREVAGFFTNAGAAGQASAEKGASVEASLQKLPGFLRELRQTMASFESFSTAGTPVSEALAKAAPALTKATRALTPFAAASTVSLKSLGANGEVAGPTIREADPVVEKIRDLGRSGATPVSELADFLVSTRKDHGFDGNNEFDKYGHFTRALTALTNCIDYVTAPTSGCSANFHGPGSSATSSEADAIRLYQRLREGLADFTGGTSSSTAPAAPTAIAPSQAKPAPAPEASGLGESEQLGAAAKARTPRRALLDYLLGP